MSLSNRDFWGDNFHTHAELFIFLDKNQYDRLYIDWMFRNASLPQTGRREEIVSYATGRAICGSRTIPSSLKKSS